MSLSVDVVVEAHDRLTGPFADMGESTDTLRNVLQRDLPASTRQGSEALSLLGSTVSQAGLEFANLGPVTRAAAMMIRSSGETAKAGWIGVLGPIALVVAGVTGIVAIVEKLKSKWAEEAEEARKAMEKERSYAKARADFIIQQELEIAKARGDQERVWELQMQQGGEAARKALKERLEEELKAVVPWQERWKPMLKAFEAKGLAVGSSPAARFKAEAQAEEERDRAEIVRRRNEDSLRLQATEQAKTLAHQKEGYAKEADLRAAAAEDYKRTAEQLATERKAQAERERQQWAESLHDPEGMFGLIEAEMEDTRQAIIKSLDFGSVLNAPELRKNLVNLEAWKKALEEVWGDIFDFGKKEKEPEVEKAQAYRQLEAFESMTALRAPGQDPMQRQVELTTRLVATLDKVEKNTAATEKNTKPAGGLYVPPRAY